FFTDHSPTYSYTLSLHDALPILLLSGMLERGRLEAPHASGRSSHAVFCRTGRIFGRDSGLRDRRDWKSREGSPGSERSTSTVRRVAEHRLAAREDWPRSVLALGLAL